MEHILLIAILERMLKKGLMNKEDLIEMRQFSRDMLARLAESVDSKAIASAHKTSYEVNDFFEGYMRAFRQ